MKHGVDAIQVIIPQNFLTVLVQIQQLAVEKTGGSHPQPQLTTVSVVIPQQYIPVMLLEQLQYTQQRC